MAKLITVEPKDMAIRKMGFAVELRDQGYGVLRLPQSKCLMANLVAK